jgi:hypothetical protein
MAHKEFQACIEACEACADACDHCSTACLQEKDVAMMSSCIRLDIDCAQICRLAVGMMARGSDFTGQICQVCADICDACAEECGRHPMDHCQECAKACKACADACRRMSQQIPRRAPTWEAAAGAP